MTKTPTMMMDRTAMGTGMMGTGMTGMAGMAGRR